MIKVESIDGIRMAIAGRRVTDDLFVFEFDDGKITCVKAGEIKSITTVNINPDDITVVAPLNDVRPHTDSIYCHCNPSVEEGGLLIIHNAFDGRHLQENYDREVQAI